MVEDTKLLDELIVGFVPHSIYAFSTPKANNFLKVGDTSRSVNIRLEEWKTKIPDLQLQGYWKATLPQGVTEQTDFFRDFALHRYFKEINKLNLAFEKAPGNSKEFFEVTLNDIEQGIQAISDDYDGGPPHKYEYLSIKDNSQTKTSWKRVEDFKLRSNQKKVVDNIIALKNDTSVPNNYLLFAVMRFGKTFVALKAAKALDSKLTVVVSGKADVGSEWKQNLQSHKDFEGYVFLDSESLKESSTALTDELKENNVVLFLTLQDLNGKNIKTKHRQLFSQLADLLIVDESHFGARAQSYGQAIFETDDQESYDEVKGLENVKLIQRKRTLHLSGTPYRILIGNEFSNPKQIVGKIQFEDILEEKEKWFRENLDKPEWMNPYFGFPQMVRFGFNLGDVAKQKLLSLTKDGAKGQLSELFGTISNDKNIDGFDVFKHKSRVLEIFKAIDGSYNSETIFPLLNYDKIQEGKMAQHIVVVLPYKASCDALERLLKEHSSDFTNLNDYKIVNIAGHNTNYKSNDTVKGEISASALKNEKTISLTVNKMLTGVTVPEWDTMLFLKDTQSPQEYDQAIYRLQSPYVSKQVNENGQVINKVDLKPQTILVDFSPNRMMSLEQHKAFILSASDGEVGNDKVRDSLERQMSLSPIITISDEKLTRVEPADVIKYIANYSSEKGIIEEANDIFVDLSVVDNDIIKHLIESEHEINSKLGISFEQNRGDEKEAEEKDVDVDGNSKTLEELNKADKPNKENKESEDALAKKLKNYYLRLLFYAFLSNESEINNLRDIINTFDNNSRLARHLGLEKNVLLELDRALVNPYARGDLDNKISNANSLLADNSVVPQEKVSRAIKSFNRISESEVFTPSNIVEKMVNDIISEINVDDYVEKPKKVLDFSSKSGIYLLVFYRKLIERGVPHGIVRENLFAISTSTIAYEFTRKVFELMDFPVENILNVDIVNSYDLIANNSELPSKIKFKGDESLEFDIIVGNPPYNESDKNDGKGSSKPLYHHFISLAKKMNPEVISLITPSVWFLGGKGLDDFRESMLKDKCFKHFTNFITAKDVFSHVTLRGGVNYFLWNKEYDNVSEGINVTEIKAGNVISEDNRNFSIPGLNLFISDNIGFKIIKKLIDDNILNVDYENSLNTLANFVSERNPFGFSTTFKNFEPESASKDQFKIYRSRGLEGFVSKSLLKKGNKLVDVIKVITPFANNIGTDLPDDNLNTKIIGKGEIVTETYLVIGAEMDLDYSKAEYLEKYLKTKFVRYLISLAKANQNGTRQTYRFVPKPDFDLTDIKWTGEIKDINEDLYRYYNLNEEEISHIESSIKLL